MAATASTVYGSAQTLTVTGLTTLASDTNLLAGWQSAVIDMAAAYGAAGGGNALDLHVQFSLTAAGSGLTTARQIQVWAWGSVDNSIFPTGLGGGVGTVTLASIAFAQMQLAKMLDTDATASRVYAPMIQLAPLFGGYIPPYVGLYVVHNMGNAFAAASAKMVSAKSVSA